ncbi:transmembrane protein 199 [Euwallacea similis]|uniref:transmembrane protein 199 n=1 Tax=Euwallacea similis TaxID=1736056 RepID=UPI0034508CC0
MTSKGQIKHTQIFVKPSQKILQYVKEIRTIEEAPCGIKNLILKNKPKDNIESKRLPKINYLVTKEDKAFIASLNLKNIQTELKNSTEEPKSSKADNPLLSLADLHWLYTYIKAENQNNVNRIYLHELLEGSKVVLPKNEEIPRNPELEKRCQKLKAEQQNREYQNMTKNVDGFRKRLPEDTIGYQLKMMNSHLIAVFQFIASVIAGFAFGFIGIELLSGQLDFGFRLMLGIACGLIVAIAELYFLAKKLNEDLELENKSKQQWQPEGKKVK